jgi:D-xylose transport system permease protein
VTITPLEKSFTTLAQGFVSPALGMTLAVISSVLFTVGVVRGRASKKKYGIKTDSLTVMMVKIVSGWGLILGVVWWMNRYLGIPMPVIILVFLALIFTFIAIKTNSDGHAR